MHNLGQTYGQMGKLTEAHQLQLQALEGAKQTFGERDLRTLDIMTAVAKTMAQQCQYQAAETMLKEVLGTKLAVDLTALHAMDILGWIYSATGQFAEAKQLFGDAFREYGTLFGHDHPNTLIMMSNLACTLRDSGRRTSATKLVRECAEKTCQRFGPDHSDTVNRYTWLKEWEAEDESYTTSGHEGGTGDGVSSADEEVIFRDESGECGANDMLKEDSKSR